MTKKRSAPVPAAVYLVADNLDAMLAAGEDLLALCHGGCDERGGDVRAAAAAGRQFADAVRTLEMMIAARCLQARARAAEVRAADARYKPLIDLFISGTATLLDAITDLGDSTSADFHTGCDAVSYLRARGVIAADAPDMHRFGNLVLSETFLVAERIQLGALMDLCATFLDRLEDHYELYADDAADDDEPLEDATEVDIPAVDAPQGALAAVIAQLQSAEAAEPPAPH